MGPVTQRLLRKVRRRQELGFSVRRFRLFLLALAGLYGALLLTSRLLGLIPDWFAPLTIVTLAAAAMALAVAFHRRPRLPEAAHGVDAHCRAKDLYLTAALIGTAAGDYRPLVVHTAEARAGSIRADQVAPVRWWRPAGHCALALAALLIAVLWLPQLDPFGRETQRREVAQRQTELENVRRAAATRAQVLRDRQPEARLSENVKVSMEELKKTFGEMNKADREGNLKRLSENQQQLGEMWRRASENRLAQALAQRPSASQSFGASAAKRESWRKQMSQGDYSAVKKEVDQLKADAEKLAGMPDGEEKRELAEQMGKRLSELKQFAEGELSSQQAAAACQNALDQLAASSEPGLSSEALEALQESLELTDLEMSSYAQSARDLQELQQALDALRAAKMANDSQPLDGSQCSQCQALADYEALYRSMCPGNMPGTGTGGGAGEGTNPEWMEGTAQNFGGGMGGPGHGQGGMAPEDDASSTAFKTEQERASLQAGKMLLQWKFRDVSQAGPSGEEYESQLKAVSEGYSEAILTEDIPPGYHEEIKRYFDSLVEARENGNGE